MVRLRVVYASMAALMRKSRSRSLVRSWADWSTSTLGVSCIEYVVLRLPSSQREGLTVPPGFESGQYPCRDLRCLQDLRLWYLEAHRRHQHGGRVYLYAGNRLLDGSRGRQLEGQGLQLQDRYLECRLCRLRDVDRSAAMEWARSHGCSASRECPTCSARRVESSDIAPPAVSNEASTSSTGGHCVVAIGRRLQVEVLRCVSTTCLMRSSKQVLTSLFSVIPMSGQVPPSFGSTHTSNFSRAGASTGSSKRTWTASISFCHIPMSHISPRIIAVACLSCPSFTLTFSRFLHVIVTAPHRHAL